jgi:hypothetical protein
VVGYHIEEDSVKRFILWTLFCAVALGSMSCKSTNAQNEVRWEYKSIVSAKKVDIAVVYNTVRQVLSDENIPSFTTQLKDKYAIETEWLGIRRSRDPVMSSNSQVPSPPDTRYPTYLKYLLTIDKKGYSISAIANSGGIQWVSYDQSYKPNVFVNVMPQTEYWDALIHLSRQINVNVKNRIDSRRYDESFTGPGSPRPFYSDSNYPAQTPAWTYPEVSRNVNAYSAPRNTEPSSSILTSLAASDDYGKDVSFQPIGPVPPSQNVSVPPSQINDKWIPLAGTNSEFTGRR